MEKREELEPMASSVGSMTPPISMPGRHRSFLSNFIARISEGRRRGLTDTHPSMLKQQTDIGTTMAAI
jgi:hypothetical protein